MVRSNESGRVSFFLLCSKRGFSNARVFGTKEANNGVHLNFRRIALADHVLHKKRAPEWFFSRTEYDVYGNFGAFCMLKNVIHPSDFLVEIY